MLFDLKHRRVDEISMEKQFTSSEPFFFVFCFLLDEEPLLQIYRSSSAAQRCFGRL